MVTRKRLPHFIQASNRANCLSAWQLPILLALVLTLAGAKVQSESVAPEAIDKNSLRLLPLAKGYLQKGNAALAQNLLETLLELYPDDVEAHLYLGEAYAAEKKYVKARSELSRCLKEKARLDISQEANKQLLKLPERVLRPRKLGSLAPTTASAKPCLILFFANWEDNSVKLKNLAESLAGQSEELTIKTFEASDPNAAAIFDLFNVSAIPTVIVLSGSKQQLTASLVGPIREESLRKLITYHNSAKN